MEISRGQEPGGLQSMGSQPVEHDRVTRPSTNPRCHLAAPWGLHCAGQAVSTLTEGLRWASPREKRGVGRRAE